MLDLSDVVSLSPLYSHAGVNMSEETARYNSNRSIRLTTAIPRSSAPSSGFYIKNWITSVSCLFQRQGFDAFTRRGSVSVTSSTARGAVSWIGLDAAGGDGTCAAALIVAVKDCLRR